MKYIKIFTFLVLGIITITSCNSPQKQEETQTEEVVVEKEEAETPEVNYFFSKVLEEDFDSVIVRVLDDFKENGFGKINEIDMHAKLSEKLGDETVIKRYTVLGLCNPKHANEALKAEPKIGVMLPCKVVIREMEDGKVEVSSINPAGMMGMLGNEELNKTAEKVGEVFEKVILGL